MVHFAGAGSMFRDMKNRLSPQVTSTSHPPGDPVAEAAHALLTAIAAEPVPPHLTALARRLAAALQAQADREGPRG